MLDLTICSASYHSQKFIDLNNSLLSKYAAYRWLVAQNGPSESFNTDVTLYEGAKPEHESSEDAPSVFEASFKHAAALNQLIAKVETRYALVLDPDFFIIRPLGEAIEHMQKNELALYGAPYNPISLKHYRYCPAAFCMFLDLSLVKDIDFTPGYGGNRIDSLKPDTGYKLFSKGLKSDHVLPVCAKAPENYEPKKYSRKTFKQLGHYDAYGLGWEEFLVSGKPFAIHTHIKIHGKMRAYDERTVQKLVTTQLRQIEECVTSIQKNDKSIQSLRRG